MYFYLGISKVIDIFFSVNGTIIVSSIYYRFNLYFNIILLIIAIILNLKVNKFISSNITLDLLYDHNQIQKTQLKQTLGVGFAYTLNNGVKRSDRKDSQWWYKK